jgi:hypothetical protein
MLFNSEKNHRILTAVVAWPQRIYEGGNIAEKNVFLCSPQGRRRIRIRLTYDYMKNTCKDRALEVGDWEKGLLWKLKSAIREWIHQETEEKII